MGSRWDEGSHPSCAGSQGVSAGGKLSPLADAFLQQQGLAGDSPKGAIKISRGGWDVTAAGRPEETVGDTGDMRCDH